MTTRRDLRNFLAKFTMQETVMLLDEIASIYEINVLIDDKKYIVESAKETLEEIILTVEEE